MHNSITTCMSHYYPRHVSGLVPPEDGHVKAPKHVEDSNVTYMLLLNCALKLVEEIILHSDCTNKSALLI